MRYTSAIVLVLVIGWGQGNTLRAAEVPGVPAMPRADAAQAGARAAQPQQPPAAQDDQGSKTLANPFAPGSLLLWLSAHGPRILGIVVVVLVLHWLIQFVGNRVIKVIVRGDTQGTALERENRARTLVSYPHRKVLVQQEGEGDRAG